MHFGNSVKASNISAVTDGREPLAGPRALLLPFKLDGPEINHIVCESYSPGSRPTTRSSLPGPPQGNDMIDLNLATVLDNIASERA